MTTQTPSLNFLLGSTASLHCGYSVAPGLDVTSVEWRLQHKGSGQLVYHWTMGQGQAKREGATLEPGQLLTASQSWPLLPAPLEPGGRGVREEGRAAWRAHPFLPFQAGRLGQWAF